MKSLPPSVHEEFAIIQGWVVSKTRNKFSAIPIDQAHEQENRTVKGQGGAVGLTENKIAVRRWMLSGPELARLLKEFQDQYIEDDDSDSPRKYLHHEQGLASQKTFQTQVNSLSTTIEKIGNPFMDDFPELVNMHSRDCVNDAIATSIRSIEETGKTQYKKYLEERLETSFTSVDQRIARNALPLFRNSKAKVPSKQNQKVKSLRDNVALFGHLYVAMQNRNGDLREFFSHEIQPFPPSLSDYGKLRLPGTKSELLHCIEPKSYPDEPHRYDCKVFDGAVIVHCLPTTDDSTFDEYALKIFIP